jgi:hypothetical protein
MRRFPLLRSLGYGAAGLVLVGAGALAGCGGSSGGGGGGPAAGDAPEKTCAALDALAGTAQDLEAANVADPEAFADALADAVNAYKDELDALRKVAPDGLQDPIDDVEHAVSKHDFSAAVTARAPLDEFATAECSPPPSPSSTGS